MYLELIQDHFQIILYYFTGSEIIEIFTIFTIDLYFFSFIF